LEALQKKTNFVAKYNKVKTGCMHAMKKYRKIGGIVPLSLKLGTRWRRVVILTPLGAL
jgi:hypothetical protein